MPDIPDLSDLVWKNRITSYSYQLPLFKLTNRFFCPKIVTVFVNRLLAVQIADWSVHSTGKATEYYLNNLLFLLL